MKEDFLVKQAFYINVKISFKGKVTWSSSVTYMLQSVNAVSLDISENIDVSFIREKLKTLY